MGHPWVVAEVTVASIPGLPKCGTAEAAGSVEDGIFPAETAAYPCG